MAEEVFQTEDMVFVAVLLMNGLHCDDRVFINGGCRWVFRGVSTKERILELLEEYNDDACFQEVRQFMRKMGQVRTEMYEFLKQQPGWRGPRQVQASR